MKSSTRSNFKKISPKESSKKPEQNIISNEIQGKTINAVKKITNSKTDTNSNQLPKPKKQMLLNGDVVNDFNFKKPQRRSRSCSYINKKSKEKSNSNPNLLDLWANLRRSERCPEKLLKDKKEQSIISQILKCREGGMRIIDTPDKGRGIESTVCFEKDSFVVEYAGDLISEKKARENEAIYKQDPSKGSYMFYFRFKDNKYCVDATKESGKLGRLLNHSKLNPNCYVKVISINDSPRLAIFAKREIEIGEELLYDYGDRDRETLEANPWLKY
uniref:SETD8 n=1 Tax=Schmidtea mediterranea TaxID=79327 RepID=A0A120H2D9_SCHMD|nr:SETD8 [Schmidtea mediterranea]